MNKAVIIVASICLFLAGQASGQVVFSSYLGGLGDDKMTGAGILSDGTVVAVGIMPGGKLSPSERVPSEKGRGDGVLLRLTADCKKVLSVMRFDGSIDDLDTDAEDNVYITGSFGSAKLSGQAGRFLWRSNVGGEGARIAAGPGGGAALLVEKRISLMEPDGRVQIIWPVDAHHVTDIACDVENKLIFVTGFNNRRGTPPGQKNYPVQVAFVHAYDGHGKKVWTAYDWKGQEVADLRLMADTRGYRLAMGPDGKLYVSGESAGGNTMWSRKSQDLSTELPLVKGDKYQVPYNTRANHITFVGRLNPRTGDAEGGAMLLARLSNGRGNTIRPRAVAADESGRIYVGGASASYPPVSAKAFGGDFDGGGAFFCAFDHEFKRVYATKFCSGTTAAIAVSKKAVVAVGDAKANLKTVQPIQAEPVGGESDGWLVVFSEKP